MRILYYATIDKTRTEYYIVSELRKLGHQVFTDNVRDTYQNKIDYLESIKPDVVMFGKPTSLPAAKDIVKFAKEQGAFTANWIFDAYFNTPPELRRKPRDLLVGQDLIILTDGGAVEYYKEQGQDAVCIRQGIPDEYNFYTHQDYTKDVRFVGSMYGSYRPKMKQHLEKNFDFEWVGLNNEYRCKRLNELVGNTKIIVGDSVISPYYWSNRVYEVVGRGGFFIHPDVEGLKDEFPDLVTYESNSLTDLSNVVEYYLEHDTEREELRQKNFEHCSQYTYKHRVKDLVCEIQKRIGTNE